MSLAEKMIANSLVITDTISGVTHHDKGWNLVSVLLVMADSHACAVYPGAYCDGGWVGPPFVEKAIPGKGYWLKFPDPGTQVMEGLSLLTVSSECISPNN